MAEVIKKVSDEAKTKGIIFDGFPRMMSQATMLEEVGAEMGMEVEKFIYLKVGVDEVISRISKRSETGGRADDKDPAVVQNRLDVFAKESVPLLEYYKNNGKLVEVDGEMSIEDAFAEIKKHL
jgi:adenylate kinase